MNKNIALAYVLSFAKNTWFWLGIWVFYYLNFTNYSGIGLIETVLIVTMTVTEIPTGAVADLFGKKKTLILAFFLEAIGAYMMAFAPDFNTILLSVFVMCVGGSFYSGTLDALVYDSLKENNKTEDYDKVTSNINSIALFAPAICSILGGFAYAVDIRLPFLLNAIGYTLGFVVSFMLVEPKIDTIKFSFKNYLAQTKQGLIQLFKSGEVRIQTMLLISIGVIVVIASEMGDGFLSFEFGFNDKQLGILWAVIFVSSAFASQITPKIRKVLGDRLATISTGLIMAVTFLLSPILGTLMGGLSLLVRSSLMGIYSNLSSIVINNNTKSKYRATTISTFNMIKNIPYVFMAYFIGSISDIFSAKTTSFYLGAVLLTLVVIQLVYHKDRQLKSVKV